MKHNKEYYKRRQKQLDDRYDKLSEEIYNLDNLIAQLQDRVADLRIIRTMIENKMQSLDREEQMHNHIDNFFKGVC